MFLDKDLFKSRTNFSGFFIGSIILWGFGVLISLGFTIAIICVAWHFIAKYW